MSGIAGIVRFDGAPIQMAQIAGITSAMSNRGPDGIRHWISGAVALGHCMLRTTPESQDEVQPLTSQDESLILVMDGRLDNREELEQDLQASGMRVRNKTDAEIMLTAYQVWGEDSPRHLLGDFAFAVWDARRRELFCARDHFGAKPFYYFSDAKCLVFASDEEALLQLEDVPCEPNEERIACQLVPEFRGYDFERSWIKDIVKLPPGKMLSVNCAGRKLIRTYWQLEPQEELRFSSDLECEEAFSSVFVEAVRRRLRTSGNPSLMLSGGIDSASIAGAARAILMQMPNKNLHTFSVVSDEAAACAETRNILSIVKGHEEYAHLIIAAPSLQGLINIDDLKEAAWKNAHPGANDILLATMMYLAASRAGHRVMLDGIDGDTAISAPTHYISSLLPYGGWRDVWAECRQASMNNTYLRNVSPVTILSKYAWATFAPTGVKRLKRSINDAIGGTHGPSFINPDFAKRIHLAERLREKRADKRRECPLSEQDRHVRLLQPPILSGAMEVCDRTASSYGLEPRHPWSDKELLEFCVRLPLRYKVRTGWTKFIVRSATAPWLDRHVRWHTGKHHLGGVLGRALLAQSQIEVAGTLGEGRIRGGAIEEYMDMKALSVYLNDGVEGSYLLQLYNAMTLALWLGRLKAM